MAEVHMNMEENINYRGARWVRADLHLHSPGTYHFTFPQDLNVNQRGLIVKQYVEQLKLQGIEIAAVTDYQQIRSDWFMPIQKAAKEQGIYVYPGVELSFGGASAGKGGLHLLAIFPYESDLKKTNHAIDKMLDNPNEPLILKDGNHRDLKPSSLTDLLPRFYHETNCLFVFAHPNDSSGIFKSYSTGEAAELLVHVLPDAIENFDEKDRQRLADTNKISREALDRIACIENSDNHNIAEIGTKQRSNGAQRSTWLKLSVLDDINAIRLTLHDWRLLTCIGAKPVNTYTHFTQLRVDGSGFLGGLDISFSPELNVLVGGRSVGKSAMLEVLRFVLDLPTYAPAEYREGLIRYGLGSGGKALLNLIQVVKPGVVRRFRFERVLGEATRIYELLGQEEKIVDLTPADVLEEREMPLFFGQKEIYDVTQSSSLQRRLLDEIIGRTARSQIMQIEKRKEDLRRNARVILERQQRLGQREEITNRLKEIGHKISLYEQYGIAEKMAQATALEGDEQRLERAAQELDQADQEWQETRRRWVERWQGVRADLERANSAQNILLRQFAQNIERLENAFEQIFLQGETYVRENAAQLQKLMEQWKRERQPLDEEIRGIKQSLGTQPLDSDELLHLTAERERLLPELAKLQKVEEEIENFRKERLELQQSLRNARHQAWKLRQEQAQNISQALQGRLSIEVEYRAQQKEYSATLENFVQGSGLDKPNVEKIASSPKVPDGIALADFARQGKDKLVQEIGLTDKRAQQLLAFLQEDEQRFFELELLSPDDHVRIALNINNTSHPLEKLSAGQRATAMLLILLTQQERLLLIDQPEDDLDNRFIFDDIVPLLRKQKGKRQLIAATHNPNIPVLAHAELIVALEARDEKAQIALQGAMDNRAIQNFVRKVMEGGEKAFRLRAEKYGLTISKQENLDGSL